MYNYRALYGTTDTERLDWLWERAKTNKVTIHRTELTSEDLGKLEKTSLRSLLDHAMDMPDTKSELNLWCTRS